MGGSMDCTTESSTIKRPMSTSQLGIKKQRRSKKNIEFNKESRNSNFATQGHVYKAVTQTAPEKSQLICEKKAKKQRKVLMIHSMHVKVKEGSRA